jgi:serine/tyrosine/threonine adenylyltransferase
MSIEPNPAQTPQDPRSPEGPLSQGASDAGQWQFDNTYLHLPAVFYTRLDPVAVREPKIVVFNQALANAIGLGFLGADPEAVNYFSGNAVPPGTVSFAQAYAGHQFGGFSMLGDGRAVVLGEHLTPDGQRIDLQLKGSGPTPYSRRGDGRAALAPMLREYLMSEAMHHLGIPSTRSLAVVSTGEPVFRQAAQPGAVLTRVAASHLRVGTFQFAAAKGDVQDLRALLTYAIKRHYPELLGADNEALALLLKVIDVQASLIVQWMRVGFIHGVMNTDNMTISGETIDYGPCAFMNRYDRETVFSSIDHQGRYAFGNQPGIAQWNLLRLAEALLPLLDPDEGKAIELAKDAIGQYAKLYTERFEQMMLNKLGIVAKRDEQGAQDEQLIADLLDWMTEAQVDYTNTFRELAMTDLPHHAAYATPRFREWHARWRRRLDVQGSETGVVHDLMNRTNPAYIPRNHLVEAALQQAERESDMTQFDELLGVLRNPYQTQPGMQSFADPGQHNPAYATFCGT